MAAVGSGTPQTIDLDTLSNADLSSLKEQFDEELQALIRSSLALQRAAGELGSSGRAAERLASQPEGMVYLILGHHCRAPRALSSVIGQPLQMDSHLHMSPDRCALPSCRQMCAGSFHPAGYV